MTRAEAITTYAVETRAREVAPSAVHPLEVVAQLESDGFSDGDARFAGYADLFGLAHSASSEAVESRATATRSTHRDRRHRMRPTELVEVAPAPARRLLVRGVVYFLPAVALAALLPPSVTPRETLVLALGLAVSWSVGQAVSYTAYQQTGLGPDAEIPFLRLALSGAVTLAAPGCIVLFATGTAGPTVALAVFLQSCVMFATITLILRRRELLLVLVLAPAVAAGAVRLVTGEFRMAGLAVAALGLAATVPVALLVARPVSVARRPRAPFPPLARTLPHAAHGALSAVLALWLPSTAGLDRAVAVGAAALVVALGTAEYLLVDLRHKGRADLTRFTDIGPFGRAVTQRFALAVIGYGAVIAIAEVLALTLLVTRDAATPAHAALVAFVMVLLGVTFLVQGVAVSMYGVTRVVPLSAIAVGALAVTYVVQGDASEAVLAVVLAVLLVASAAVAVAQSLIPSNHR